MKLRSPSLLTLSIILLCSVTGLFSWRAESLQEFIVSEVKSRKNRDSEFAARILSYSQTKDYNNAIARSHRNTLVLVLATPSKKLVATNLQDLALNTVPGEAQDKAIKMSLVEDEISFQINCSKYHVVTDKINPQYRLILITNITKTIDENWTATFLQLFLIWLVMTGGLLVFGADVAIPIFVLRKAADTGQRVKLRRWWPSEAISLAESYNQLLQAQEEAAQRLRHDIRTASGAVTKAADNIERSGLTAEMNDYQQGMWISLKECSQLTCTLVDDIGRLWEPLTIEPRPLSELLAPLKALYVSESIQWGDFPDDVIKYDKPAIISKVLANIINNALKYSGPNSIVRVGVKRKDKMLTVFVADNGEGLNSDQINKIMTSYGASARLKPDIPGTGTGISSARNALKGHGWQLRCKSTLGSGTIFYFEIKINE